MLAAFGEMLARVTVVNQGVDVAIGDGKYSAASAAITTIGSTFRNEFFTAKTVRAIAAFTGNHFNGGFVDEFHKRMVP